MATPRIRQWVRQRVHQSLIMPKRKRASSKVANESVSNLNQLMPRKQATKVVVKGAATLLFNPHILPYIRALILKSHYVVLSVAWVSNRAILEALRSVKGCSVIVTHDNAQLRKFREPLGLLPAMQGAKSAVFTVNSGRSRALMHHKYLVVLDEHKQPTGQVVTGSWNYTAQSTKNLEHVLALNSPDLARELLKDHNDILRCVAKPLRPYTKKKKKKKKMNIVFN